MNDPMVHIKDRRGFPMVTQGKSPHGRRHGPIYESPPVLARGMLVLLFIVSMIAHSSAQNLINSGTINNTGTIRVKGEASGLPSAIDGIFEYFGASQNVPAVQYKNLVLSGSGTKSTETGDFGVTTDLSIASLVTLSIESSSTITLGGTLSEQGKLTGAIKKTVDLSGSTTSSDFGGIGATISWSGTEPGSTSVMRSSGTALTGNGNQSIKRYYDIVPTTNSGLNATLVFEYSDDELNSQNASTLELWRSIDGGVTWIRQGGAVDTAAKTITKDGITSFSLWTAADADHPLGTSAIVVNAKIFLQGPYSNGSMSTALNGGGYIPLDQPYNTSPWNYAGTESVTSVPAGVVDWMLVDLRSTSDGPVVARRAGFVKSDGLVVDIDGSSPLAFSDVSGGDYYIVIRHRNHLAIMSANVVTLSSSSELYDFTTSQSKAFGTEPMADLGGGVFGMWAGDVNANGTLKFSGSGNDRALILTRIGGTDITLTVSGYYAEDVNMNGIVKYSGAENDRAVILTNIGGTDITLTRATQVP